MEDAVVAVKDGYAWICSRVQKDDPLVESVKLDWKLKLSFNFAAETLILPRGCTWLSKPHRVHDAVHEFEAFRFGYCNGFSEDLA